MPFPNMTWQSWFFFHVMSCHVMSCHVMSCHVMSCHVMSCRVVSWHVMSSCVLLRYPQCCCQMNVDSKALGGRSPSAICVVVHIVDVWHPIFFLVVPIYAGFIRAYHLLLFMLCGLMARKVFLNIAVCSCASGPDFAITLHKPTPSSVGLCLAYINAAGPCAWNKLISMTRL